MFIPFPPPAAAAFLMVKFKDQVRRVAVIGEDQDTQMSWDVSSRFGKQTHRDCGHASPAVRYLVCPPKKSLGGD